MKNNRNSRLRSRLVGMVVCGISVLAPAISVFGQSGSPRKPLNPPGLPSTYPIGPEHKSGSAAPSLSAPAVASPNGITWTAVGPAPLSEGATGLASGRIAGIAVDSTNANNIYIAAAGGGIWNTTNGGGSWSPLTDTQSTLAMGAIAIAPSNPLKIYAGTGEGNNSLDSDYGLGILHSEDGGVSWALSTGPSGAFSRKAIGKISVDPHIPNTAYAAINDFAENGTCCSGTGIYKTTDGGVTWVNVTSAVGLDSSYPWSDVLVDPNNTSIIYAAHGDIFGVNTANGVYRSVNGGSTWALLSSAPSGSGIGRIALAIAPSAATANQHVLYVAIAQQVSTGTGALFEMLRSDNADAAAPTFTNLSGTPNFLGGQGWYDIICAVNPVSSADVYCAGVVSNNVIRSLNSGVNWTNISTAGGVTPHTDSHAMAFDSTGRLLLGNDGGIWRFDPTGSTSWTDLNGNLNTIQLTGIGIHPTNTTTILGGSQDNGTELSTGSVQWSTVDGGDGGYSQISQTNPLICYSNHPIASFGTNFFTVSTDGCNTFTRHTPSITNQNLFNFYSPIFVDPANGNRVFLGGDGVYESINAASSWTKHTNPSTNSSTGGQTAVNSIAVLPGGNTIYISAGGTLNSSSQIWVSVNDGASWTQHSLPVVGAVQEIDVDPNDSTGNTAVAVINNFSTAANGQVYRTTNGGVNWTNISGSGGTGLPVLPTWSAKIGTDANKTIYVGNETGVYSSPSPYGVWTAVGSGLPHAQVVSLQLNSSTHELAVGTHGRGAWSILTVPPATVTNVTSATANGTYGVGAVISVQISFTSAVTVTGTPSLALNSGGTANYVSGTGTSTLSFNYTVAPGQNSAHLDYTSTSALNLNGGTITGIGPQAAILTLPAPGTAGSLGANKNIVIDTVAPTVVSYKVLFGVTSFNMSASTRNRLPWQITGVQVLFSKPVVASVASFSGLSATGVSGSGTSTVTWTLSPIVNLPATITKVLGTTASAVVDLAGNALGGGTDFSQTVKVLYGDFNDDGTVNSQDGVGVNAARTQPYNIFADLNGDGVVDINDVNVVRAQVGSSNP